MAVIADGGGNVLQRLSYDAWGMLRNPTGAALCQPCGTVTSSTTRGYTNHEEMPSYNAIGNITSKSDTGSYSYNGTGPQAVSSISGTVDCLTNPNYSYDPNGNLTCISSGGGCSGNLFCL